MKRAKIAPPEELLAAYADGGVDDEERAIVEQYLAENPAAREELEAIRELVARTRNAVPRPVEEPEWSKMARRIIAMCELEQDEPRSVWQRAGDWLARAFRPRPALLLGAAATAIVLFAVWRGSGTPGAGNTPRLPIATDHSASRTGDETATSDRPDSRPEVDWGAVEDILAESAGDSDDAAASPGDPNSGPDDDPNSDDDEVLEYAVGGLELFAEPDYESWLDDLSADELDALYELLRETQAG